MGLLSATTTALTGMQAAESIVDVVGNNVANSNTVGFKQSSVIFATQFLQTQSIGSAPNGNLGGTNPRQIGLGVKVASITPTFSQGTIEISANPLDVAIQGDGFFVAVDSQGKELFTRNGQFKLNKNNEIVTATGQKVLGYGVNDNGSLGSARAPITIPLGGQPVNQETTIAKLKGILNPKVDPGGTPAIVESVVLGNDAIPEPGSANFTTTDLSVSPTPAVGTATQSSTAGTGPLSGNYSYKVAFLDANGNEGPASAAFTFSANGLSPVELASLPVPTDTAAYPNKRIYRTDAGGSTFKQLSTIASTATTHSDADSAAILSGAAIVSGGIDDGTYSYYVTYYNSVTDVESRPTQNSGTITIADGDRVRVNLSDVSAPAGSWNKVRIYRNESGISSPHYRVATLDYSTTPSVTPVSFVDTAQSSVINTNAALDLDGPKAKDDTLLTDVIIRNGAVFDNPFKVGVLSLAGTKGGADQEPRELTIASTTTVRELRDFMEQALGIHPSVPNTASGSVKITDGKLQVTSNFGERNAIDIGLTAFELTTTTGTQTTTATVSLPFDATQEGVGPGTSTNFFVYDSLGSAVEVQITTVRETVNTDKTTRYRWYANSPDHLDKDSTSVTTVVGSGFIEFDQFGNLKQSLGKNEISIEFRGDASESPMVVELDFADVFSKDRQNAAGQQISSLNLASQDGFPPGTLSDFIITDSGVIQGQYTNGVQRVIGQVAMARFTNNQGLQQVGDSLFATGVNSGEPEFGIPGENGIGTLTAGATELSNTDIGQNLIKLVLASTQYRGGARVITAAQELLDELLAIRR